MKGFYRFVGSRRFIVPLVIAPFVYLAWVFVTKQDAKQEPISPPEGIEASEVELYDLENLGFDPSIFTVTDAEHEATTRERTPDEQPEAIVSNLKERITDDTGNIAVAFVLFVLCLTPLKVLFRRNKLVSALNRHRRTVGLTCFFYASLHLGIYLTNGLQTLFDEITRVYIAAGLSAFVILLVLALTSNNRAQRKLGGRRWKKLHRIVYLAIPILIYHRAYAGKVSPETIRETLIWFSPLLVLLLLRVIKQALERRTKTRAIKSG